LKKEAAAMIRWTSFAWGMFIVAGFISCSATPTDRDHSSSSGSGASGNAGSGASSSSSGSSGGGGEGGTVFTGGGGTGGDIGPCLNTCSNDLTQVVDCNGNVIETCADGMACAFGTCANDACQAAQKSGSSIGCDFWALKTDVIFQGSGACFAAFLANTWSTPAHIQVEREGAPLPNSAIKIPKGQGFNLMYTDYDPNVGLAPGEVAILFLSRGPGFFFIPDCPVPAGFPVETGVLGTGLGKAFHIQTDSPVVAYQILPYGGGASAMTSASLLLPTGVWGTNYLAASAYKNLPNGQPSLALLAREDDTEVTILPKVPITGGGGVPAGGPNASLTVKLARGQYVQFTQDQELSGSPVQSNKPIAMFGAASCMNIPVSENACDTGHQQIPPISALGHAYVGANHRHRTAATELEPWRIMGAVDGTKLTWTPAPPPGAPSEIASGQMMEFAATDPFYVTSQDANHPFYLSSYMTGGEKYGGIGDPEWVNAIPTDQFLKDYVLFTDPTYSETSLVVTRARGDNGMFANVILDCAGPLTNWKPVGQFETTVIDLVTGNFQNVGNCSNGRHEIHSDAPFGVTVWGWGTIPGFPGATLYTQYVSYAYPAGAGVKPINTVEIPVPK
jgi:hypothetical protein